MIGYHVSAGELVTEVTIKLQNNTLNR